MGALSKAEIAAYLERRHGLEKKKSAEYVESFFQLQKEALISGESVRNSGFGNYDLRDKAERPGRNPKTRELVPVSARRVVTFHTGQKLKTRLMEAAQTKERG